MNLIVSTHTGDEIIGCGILMSRRPQDYDVIVVGAGVRGYSEDFPGMVGFDLVRWRNTEAITACKNLGITCIKFLGYLYMSRKDIVDDLLPRFDAYKKVFIPSRFSVNDDRKLISSICCEYKNVELVEYNVDSDPVAPDVTLQLSEGEKQFKQQLLNVHRSQRSVINRTVKNLTEYFWYV